MNTVRAVKQMFPEDYPIHVTMKAEGDIYAFSLGEKVAIGFSPPWHWTRPFNYRDGGGQFGCAFLGNEFPHDTTATIIAMKPEELICTVVRPMVPTDPPFMVEERYRTSNLHVCWLRPSVSWVMMVDSHQEQWWNGVIREAWRRKGGMEGWITPEFCNKVMKYRKHINPENRRENIFYKTKDPAGLILIWMDCQK